MKEIAGEARIQSKKQERRFLSKPKERELRFILQRLCTCVTLRIRKWQRSSVNSEPVLFHVLRGEG